MEKIIEGINDKHLEPIQILRLFETTKAERSSFVVELVERLESGELDPLKTHLQVKAMEDIIQMITSKDFKKNKNVNAAMRYGEIILDAALKHGSKPFEFGNAKMEIKEAGTKYNFENCGDAELDLLYQSRASLDEKIKDRETFLKTIPAEGMTIVHESSGEVHTLYPPLKTSTTTLFTTLK